jgi:N-acetylglutamate synthase-like GNAT family acetyltransferase
MTELELNKIVDFYEKYLGTHDRSTAKEYIKEHLKYGTVDYAADENGNVIGLCRWNIDGTTARIIDLAIAPEWRKKGLGKHFLVRGLKIWKNVTHVEFERGLRGDHRRKKIPIGFILKHNNF